MQTELNDLMDTAKELLKDEITRIAFDTWIKNLELVGKEGNTYIIAVTSNVHKDSINSRYYDLILNTFKYITNSECEINLVLAENAIKQAEIIANDSVDAISGYSSSSLNPKYTFDTFVVGNSNRFAHAAALAVAEAPATSYNPLFLYGGVGLGKTHLMHSIGNAILKKNNSSKVLYVTSEKFTNHLINAIKDNKTEEFRNTYRNVDVLLIDDIQFIAGKERIQEEFFHTFNTLHESGKQIIISSDRPPKEMKLLEDRLKSRFEWGLIADISNPDYETRLAILRKKAQFDNITIDDMILSNIATKIDS
ncbi:MAG: chromosomal replication initiator protein DnaA, partial [Clostridia bacterium]|nr:chromosomal replication initiator protein DnaA [Clostridia bacterium]